MEIYEIMPYFEHCTNGCRVPSTEEQRRDVRAAIENHRQEIVEYLVSHNGLREDEARRAVSQLRKDLDKADEGCIDSFVRV